VVNDYPEPEVFPRPDAVLAVESGRLRIPPRDGYKATADMREGCPFCRLYLLHEHEPGRAAFPF
jgi:hypothetical protein